VIITKLWFRWKYNILAQGCIPPEKSSVWKFSSNFS